MTTINAVTTLNSIHQNNINISLMERDCGYQIYFINKKNKDLSYTDLSELNEKIRCAINKNKTFYLTFCGISKNGKDIPDYYYMTLRGHQIKFENRKDNLIFNFDINANLENILSNIFKENIGLFIQIYL